jgi:amino acid transporter
LGKHSELAAGDKFSVWQLLAYSFGGMIGSGWLLGASEAAGIAGGLAWASWLLAGLAMLIIGIVMMELGRAWGGDGGLVWWPFNSSGPRVAMVVVAAIWIFYALSPASEAAAAVQFGSHWLPWLFDHTHDRITWPGVGVSALLVILLVAANLLGLRLITRITKLAGIFKVAVPVVVLGLLIRSGFGGHTHPAHPVAAGGWGGILTAVTGGGVIYTYIGFQAPVDFGGRARNPERDIPRAVIAPIIFGIVLFPLLQILSAHDGLLGTGWNGISYDSPYARLAVGIAIWHLSVAMLVRIDTIVSPLGSGLVFSAALAHTVDDISSQQLIALPGTSPQEADPAGETASTVARPVLVVNLLISLAFLPILRSWIGLVDASGVITVFVYAAPSISHAALVRSRPPSVAGVVDRLRRPLSGFAPVSFWLMTLILYWAEFRVLALGTGLTTALALLLMRWRPRRWRGQERPGWDEGRREVWRQWPDSRRPASWLFGYLGGLMVLCWLRQYGPAGEVRWLWSVLALALGIVAFRGLVRSSQGYMEKHPPKVGRPPSPPDSAGPACGPETGLPPAPEQVIA